MGCLELLQANQESVGQEMKPSSAKAKGRLFQQYIRDLILERWTTLEPDDCKSTGMGQSGEDVQLSPAARKLVPLSIECKSRAKIALYKDYEQAESNCPKGSEPVLCVKANRKEPMVFVRAEYFFDLMKGRQ